MSHLPQSRKEWHSWFWLIAAVLLALVGNGRWLIPLATWLAALFFLRFAHSQKPFPGLILGGIGMIAATHVNWLGMTPLDDDPILYTLVFVGIGLTFWLPYCIDRLVSPRIQGFATTLVFPLAYVAMELIYTLTNPFLSWGSLAYTQTGWLSLIQIASVTGIWGITFLIAWTVSVVHWIWNQQCDWKTIRAGAVVYLAVMAAVIGYGQIRLTWFQPRSETVRTATVAASAEDIDWITAGEKSPQDMPMYYRKVFDHYLDRTRGLAQAGAQIVIWDELAVRTTAAEEAAVIEEGKTLARQEQIYLLMVIWVEIPPNAATGSIEKARENKAVLIGPDGSILFEYLKGNPTPGSRDVHGNDEVGRADTPFGLLGAAICYDTVNPEFFRTAGNARLELLMVPTWDYPEIENLHMAMSRMRAVENGSSLVISAREGYSAAIDYLGRPLAVSGRNTPDRTMFADVPIESIRTIYPIIGDLFGWLCTAGLFGMVLFSIVKARSTRK